MAKRKSTDTAKKKPAKPRKPRKKKTTPSDPRFKVERDKVATPNKDKQRLRKARGLPPTQKERLRGLRPFKPGVGGNPLGLPHGYVSLTQILRRELGKKATGDANKTKAEAMVRNIVSFATCGDAKLLKLLMAYSEGSPAANNVQTMTQQALNAIGAKIAKVITDTVEDDEQAARLLTQLGSMCNLHASVNSVPDPSPSNGNGSLQKSIKFYQDVVDDPTVPINNRLKAQERIDILLGNDKSQQAGLGEYTEMELATLKLPLKVRKQILEAMEKKKAKDDKEKRV